jgi:maleate isomerase
MENSPPKLSKGTVVQSPARQVRYGDSYDHRGSLGFIVLATDLVMEENLYRLAPKGVGVAISRVASSNDISSESLGAHVDTMAEAAALIQPDASPDLICYACTSGSIVIGEERVAAEIRRGAPHSCPMTLVTGVVDALRTLGVSRLVVGTPYLDEINSLELDYLIDQEFSVLDMQGLNVDDGAMMGRIAPEFIKEFALSIDRPDADGIFISCGGIRTIDVVQEIEETAGKPVICSNQAMMWSCLRRIGVTDAIPGYGRLFEITGIPAPYSPWDAKAA